MAPEKHEIILRPYQKECVDIINNLEGGNHMVVMATGLGKTATFAQIKRRGRVLILSHREELVHQPERYYDCSFGVERAEEHSNGEEVVSASVQTLTRRLSKFKNQRGNSPSFMWEIKAPINTVCKSIIIVVYLIFAVVCTILYV